MSIITLKPGKRENELKARQCEVIRERMPGFVLQLHQQVRGSGTPDLSLDGLARTSWWEFKHATPDFKSPGIQEVTCCRLAAASFCRYVIFYDDGRRKETQIVKPTDVRDRLDFRSIKVEFGWVGFKFEEVADFMRQVHERGRI